MWNFLNTIFTFFTCKADVKMDKIVKMQEKFSTEQKTIKEILMSVKTELEEFAANVDTITNAMAVSVQDIATQLATLRQQLADAGTPEQVDEVLNPVAAKLSELALSLTAVAAPPVEPPVEPPL